MADKEIWQGQEVIKLQGGNSEAWVDANQGGKLLQWRIDGKDLLYWPDEPDWSLPAKIRGGNPVLFPFIARHLMNGDLGKWQDGETVRDMPMHGFARDHAFEVQEATGDMLVLNLHDQPATREFYPFSFLFQVTYRLEDPTSLSITFRVENRDTRPLPYYAGHHFYFPVPHGERDKWKLEIPCSRTARQRADGSIEFQPPAELPDNLADPQWVDRFHLLEPEPTANLRHESGSPHYRFHLEPAAGEIPWYAITTWTEKADSDFFCVEPWLGLPNAIHHGHGLRSVAPGEAESARCRIQVEL